MKRLLLLLAVMTIPALGQVNPLITGSGAPSNPCGTAGQFYEDTSTGNFWSCPSSGSNWRLIGGGSNSNGGGAGVTISTVSALPAGKPKGTPAVVTDGSTSTDCTVGGGTNLVLCRYDGSAWGQFVSGSASAGGSSLQVQYNSSGSLAGDADLTYTAASHVHTFGAGGLALPGSSGTVTLKGAGAITSYTLTFPTSVSAGFFRTDGSGNLTYTELSGDCTTSGSGAITCTKTNGVALTGAATMSTSAGGDLSGTYPATITVSGLKGSALPSLSSGYLHYNGTSFVFDAPVAAAGGSSGQLQFNSAGVISGVTSSSVSGANVSLGGTFSVTGASTFSQTATFTLPTGSTADTLDACGVDSLPSCFRVDANGQATFQAGSAIINGASFVVPQGAESLQAAVGSFINNSSNVLESFNGSIWTHVAYGEVANSFTQQNTYTQPAAATIAKVEVAAGSATADFEQLQNSSLVAQAAWGCQSGDTNCPVAFGAYAPAFATIGTPGAAGQKTFGAGTDQGVPSFLKGVTWEGPATVTPSTGFVLRTPATEPAATSALMDFSAGCASDICAPTWVDKKTTINNVAATLGASVAIPGFMQCADTSGSGTAQSCNTTPSFTPVAGSCVIYTTTTANTGALTININSLGAKSVVKYQGTALASGDIKANVDVPICYDGTNLDLTVIGNAPSGSGTVTTTGSPASGQIATFSGATSITTATAHNMSAVLTCADSSGSGTTQSCSTSPTFTPAANDCIVYTTTTANTGALTINVNSLGAKSAVKWLGTALASGDVPANHPQLVCYDGTNWDVSTIGNAPSGVTVTASNYNMGVPLVTSTGNSMTANQEQIFGLYTPLQLTVSNIAFYVQTADASSSDHYDIGVYNSSGTLICSTGAMAGGSAPMSTTGFKTRSCTEGSNKTVAAGEFYIAITCDNATGKFAVQTSNSTPIRVFNSNIGTTSGGVLLSSFTAPSDSVTVTSTLPFLALY